MLFFYKIIKYSQKLKLWLNEVVVIKIMKEWKISELDFMVWALIYMYIIKYKFFWLWYHRTLNNYYIVTDYDVIIM